MIIFIVGIIKQKLTDLTSVRQGRDESIMAYFKRFKDVKNWCFNCQFLKEIWLIWILVVCVLILKKSSRVMTIFQLINFKSDLRTKSTSSKIPKKHIKLIGPTHMLSSTNPTLQTMRKKRCVPQNLFGHQRPNHVLAHCLIYLKRIGKKNDVSKCDHIFDELFKNRNIKLSHTIPPLEELKRRAYCKWHNSSSHATNDCNVFRR